MKSIDYWFFMDGPEDRVIVGGWFCAPGLPGKRVVTGSGQTSPVVSMRYGTKVVVTATGSRYRLRRVSPDYVAWVAGSQGGHHRVFSKMWDRGPGELLWLKKTKT